MAEVGFFPKYEQKENKITNYTLLMLKQLYNESPKLFQEFIVSLIKDNQNNIDVGVNFWQQKGSNCDNGKSIFDGVISQSGFTIFIETKLSDWFYSEQLERHLSNIIQQEGKKIFLTLCNFDGKKSEVFEQFMKKYQDSTDVIFAYFDFGDFIDILENLKSKIKSESFLIMLDEFEDFLDSENLLPTWKYRLDVVNCAKTKEGVIANKLYCCPEPKGAYKHARSKYFGIYDNKKVDCIAEIKAVCTIDEDKNIKISWYDNAYSEAEILNEAKEKKIHVPYEPMQMFLLTNFKENLNFYKNSKGGMFGSKIYFNFDNTIKDIDDLTNLLKDKTWSEFQ